MMARKPTGLDTDRPTNLRRFELHSSNAEWLDREAWARLISVDEMIDRLVEEARSSVVWYSLDVDTELELAEYSDRSGISGREIVDRSVRRLLDTEASLARSLAVNAQSGEDLGEDQELYTMGAIVVELMNLDPATRHRVASWAAQRAEAEAIAAEAV